MKRQTFIEIIEDIQRQARQDRETTEKLADIMVDSTGFYTTRLITSLVITLEAEFDDDDSTIAWWLWDAPHAGKNKASCVITDEKHAKTWHITDSGKLYDYLVEMQEAKNAK